MQCFLFELKCLNSSPLFRNLILLGNFKTDVPNQAIIYQINKIFCLMWSEQAHKIKPTALKVINLLIK